MQLKKDFFVVLLFGVDFMIVIAFFIFVEILDKEQKDYSTEY